MKYLFFLISAALALVGTKTYFGAQWYGPYLIALSFLIAICTAIDFAADRIVRQMSGE